MGLLDKFLKKDTGEQERQQMSRRNEYTMPSLDGENEIMAYGLSSQGKIKHRNQEITDLIMARITKYRDGDAIYFDASDYIAFELPLGQEVNEQIMQAVMRQYEEESRKNPRRSYYIGRLEQRQGIYDFGSKSNSVENIVNSIVDKNERIRQEQIEASMRAKGKREQEFRKSMSETINSYMEDMKRTRYERKTNPWLKQQGTYQIEGRTYTDYDGIDIYGGDILRVRKVDKVGKDGSGTYLYSAYLSTTTNEHDVELLGKGEPIGFPVCFTLEKRLEDIVREGNVQEVNTLLSLLSSPGNFENSEKLAYIGGIDKTGQVIYPTYMEQYDSYTYNRGLQFPSTAIGMKIQSMQQEYARQRQEKREQEGRGE